MSSLDRAAGALLGLAAGDALGAGYEFGPPLEPLDEIAAGQSPQPRVPRRHCRRLSIA